MKNVLISGATGFIGWRLVRAAGNIEIQYTGLRLGEKFYEELFC